jgi:hypothetical protein
VTRPEPARYRHAEAFAVMEYISDDGSEREKVWNSRDGVTPFVITLPSGKPATHHNWAADQRMPEDWVPPPGMRCFTDLTAARARELAVRAVDGWLAEGFRDRLLGQFGDRDDAIDALTAEYFKPGAPDLVSPPRDPPP